MPDAAKLTAAFGLALLGFILSLLVMGLYEEETNFGWFVYVNVALGIAVGWIVVGRRAGRGITSAINVGFSGAIVLIFWGLFVQSCNEMTRLAMRNRYDSAFEAIIAVFQIGAEWAFMIATVPILATAAVGGVLTGLATEAAWRNYR